VSGYQRSSSADHRYSGPRYFIEPAMYRAVIFRRLGLRSSEKLSY